MWVVNCRLKVLLQVLTFYGQPNAQPQLLRLPITTDQPMIAPVAQLQHLPPGWQLFRVDSDTNPNLITQLVNGQPTVAGTPVMIGVVPPTPPDSPATAVYAQTPVYAQVAAALAATGRPFDSRVLQATVSQLNLSARRSPIEAPEVVINGKVVSELEILILTSVAWCLIDCCTEVLPLPRLWPQLYSKI